MQTKDFLKNVTIAIQTHFANVDNEKLTHYEVIQVWYCKTIQNHKGLFIAKDKYGNILPYFIECTYNGDKKELYLDFYTKEHKGIIKY